MDLAAASLSLTDGCGWSTAAPWLLNALQFLDSRTLATADSVCKGWRVHCNSDVLWYRLALMEGDSQRFQA